MKRSLLTTLVFLCGSLPSVAHAQQNAPAQSWEIPFSLYRNFMVVVQGSIGELDQLNFLVDTGTNPSVVDKRIAKKLHLAGSKSILPVVSGQIASFTVVVPSVSIGPVGRSAVRMDVQDMAMLERQLGIRIDAMVGLDVLGGSSFRIDYEARSITFGPPRNLQAEGATFQSQPPFITVEVRMNQQPVHLLVDTGSSELVLFESHISSKLRALAGAMRTSRSLGGALSLREVQLTDTQVGDSNFGARRAYVASDHNSTVPFDGLLGVSALNLRQISFDFEHNLFTWQAASSWIPTMTGENPGSCTTAAPDSLSRTLVARERDCPPVRPRPMSPQ